MRSPESENTHTSNNPVFRRRGLWLLGVLLLGAALAMGYTFLTGDKTAGAGLPDLLGTSQPALAAGILQVDDLKSDPKGYTGSIVVRGVVAKFAPGDARLVGLIDSREARVCRDLNCAQYYLPVRVNDADLQLWEEVDVRGTMTPDPVRKIMYLHAESIQKHGSVKR